MFCPKYLSKVALSVNSYSNEYLQVFANITRCIPEPRKGLDCLSDNLFQAFVDTAVGALFVPKNTISIKDHVAVPLDSAWEKAYEFKIDLNLMEHIDFSF